jgi:hypothetical protein
MSFKLFHCVCIIFIFIISRLLDVYTSVIFFGGNMNSIFGTIIKPFQIWFRAHQNIHIWTRQRGLILCWKSTLKKIKLKAWMVSALSSTFSL